MSEFPTQDTSISPTRQIEEPDRIVFFDGVCHLCNGSVEFLIKRNKGNSLFYSPLQSEFAAEKLGPLGIDTSNMESILYLREGKLYKESSAALQLCRELTFPWTMAVVFLIVPQFIRNFFYRIIAKNRYNWFGKKDQCMIPSPEVSHRFIF